MILANLRFYKKYYLQHYLDFGPAAFWSYNFVTLYLVNIVVNIRIKGGEISEGNYLIFKISLMKILFVDFSG